MAKKIEHNKQNMFKKNSFQQVIIAFNETLLPKKKKTYVAYHLDNGLLKVFSIQDKPFFYFPFYTKGKLIAAPHPRIRSFLTTTTPVMHATYEQSGIKKGSIVYYETEMSLDDLIRIAEKEEKILDLRLVEKNKVTQFYPFKKVFSNLTKTIDEEYNLRITIANNVFLSTTPNAVAQDALSDDTSLINDILPAIPRQDVIEYCKGVPAKKRMPLKKNIVQVPKILPHISLQTIIPSDKSLNRAGKGDYYSGCPILRGSDTSTGCVVNRSPDGFYDSSLTCDFCYAKRLATKPYANTIFTFSKDRWKKIFLDGLKQSGDDKKTVVLQRLGQDTEVMVPEKIKQLPGFFDGLEVILESLTELNNEREQIIRTTLVTKMPTDDVSLMKKLVAANVVVGVSIGYETYGLENGARAWGYTTAHRLKLAKNLAEHGVPTYFFVMTDVSRPFTALQKDARLTLDFFEKNKQESLPLYFQFLESRITKKSLAPVMGGASWDELKKPKLDALSQDLFSQKVEVDVGGRWDYHKKALVPNALHEDFQKLIGNNRGDIRMCYTYGPLSQQKCGLCFTDKLFK